MLVPRKLALCAFGSLFVLFASPLAAAQEKEAAEKKEPNLTSSVVSGLKFRTIGPAFTSGRISDIAVNPRDHSHWYVTAASGGVWETKNCGTTWKPIFDGQSVYSIGCVAIDPNDPLTVWVGTGENNSQRSVSYGDGVYKSTNGGKAWKNVGLKSSEHIGKILIDPVDSNRVFVAAQGPLWSAGGDRGLYRTEDGGETWDLVLEIDEHTGVSDIVQDPRDADVLYATSYQRRRHVWTLINGGPGSAVWKSTDGGDTWNKLRSGLPGGDVGRIALAVAPTRGDTVYAIVEALGNKGGFFRSTDAGGSWRKMSSYVSGSPQYYQEIFVDPKNPDRIYSMDVYMKVSNDGGATWGNVGETNKHVDNHALWIDPVDTRHLVAGCDGGVYETFDRGSSWQFKANLSITQFYRITADNDFPFYNVYGGTQDNFSLGAPSRTTSRNGITNRDWFVTLGGDGFETVVDPEDPDVLYAQYQYGGLARYDRRSGETVDIKPRAGVDDEPLRWNWNAPIIISPHLHTRLYFAANYLFRSDDRGNSWTKVSGNLTSKIDRNQLEVMGKVWSVDSVSKNRSTSIYGNVVALAESPLLEGYLWCGTDDGLIQVTRNGGDTWRKLEGVADVPEMTYVSCLTPSLHAEDTVYASFDDRKRGNFKPYVLKSTNGGRSWTSIAGDLPENGTVHSIAEDHEDPNLLFAGTEFGLWVTVDGGERWLRMKGGLPTISVRDVEIQRRENDLVLATFGRGIYILDDYSSLRHMSEEALASGVKVFPMKDSWQFMQRGPLGGGSRGFQGHAFYSTPNPPVGAVFTYYVAKDVSDSLRTRKSKRIKAEKKAAKDEKPIDYPTWDELRAEDREVSPKLYLSVRDMRGELVRRVAGSTSQGLHRATWDMRHASRGGFGGGPLAVPGEYTVSVETLIDGNLQAITEPAPFRVVPLPGPKFPAENRAEMLAFQTGVQSLNESARLAGQAATEAGERLDAIDAALLVTPNAKPEWMRQAHLYRGRLADIKVALQGDRTISSRYEAQLPSIRERVRVAMGSFRTTAAPTQTQEASFEIAAGKLEGVIDELRQLNERDLTNLENLIVQAGGPAPPKRLPNGRRRQ